MTSFGNLYGQPHFISNVIIQNEERVDELNDRIFSRNIGTHNPIMSFDPRSQTTSNTIFPGMNPLRPTEDNNCLKQSQYFNTHKHFLPGDKQPYSGFASQVRSENELILNPSNCDRAFIPNSNSDLFQEDHTLSTKVDISTHPLLNRTFVFQPRNMNPFNLGSQQFIQASTRTDVRNIDPIQ